MLSGLPANGRRLSWRSGMRLPIARKDRLERFFPPEPWSANVFQARGVPIEPRARRRFSGLDGPRDGVDIPGLGVDVERGRIAFAIAMMLSASEGDQLVQP